MQPARILRKNGGCHGRRFLHGFFLLNGEAEAVSRRVVGDQMRKKSAVAVLLLSCAALAGCADEGRSKSFEGPWQRHTIDGEFRGADGVRLADVNGDGLPDITTGWENDGITRAYVHPGYEAAREPWPAVTVGHTPNVEDAVWADVDGDGNMDVVSSSEGGTQSVFVSFAPSDPADFLDPDAWTTGAFPATAGRKWMYAAPMDVDGQRGIDLVIGGKQTGAILGWLESPQDPRDLAAWKLHEISTAGWVMSIDTIDVNGDGLLDVLVSDRARTQADGVRWLEQPADPAARTSPWEAHLVGARRRSPTFVAPIFDLFGRLSGVVVPSGGERLTLFEREDDAGLLWSEHGLRYPHRLGTPKAAAVGDIDLDGTLDIVVSTTNLSGLKEGIVWLPSAGEPRKDPSYDKESISGAQGQKFDRMELFDVDGDGDLDVMTTEEIEDLGVLWYENPLLPEPMP